MCGLPLGQPLSAAVIASEDFSYPDGLLGNSTGGTGWTIPWLTASNPNGGWEVHGGQAVSVPVDFGSYVQRWYANPASGPELFLSVDISLPDMDLNDTIIMDLFEGANFTALRIGKPPGSTEFALGTSSSWVSTGVTAAANTTFHVIGLYDIDSSRVAMWVNPAGADYYNPSTAESSADAIIPFNPGHVGALVIYCYGPNGRQKGGVGFDNLLLATTPGDVGLLSSAPADCPGDADGDRDVDLDDLLLVLGGFGGTGAGDVDGDSDVDLDDLLLVLGGFGTTCA